MNKIALSCSVCIGLATALWLPVTMATPSNPPTTAPAAGPCGRSSDAVKSWDQGLARMLKNNDPSHAAQLSKVASAVINGQVDVVKNDIAAGLNPNSVLKVGPVPADSLSMLTLAAAACQADVAQLLLAAGASPNGPGSPLVTASAAGDSPMVTLLLNEGAKIDEPDASGHTALEDAVRQHQRIVVEQLLNAGANPNLGTVNLLHRASLGADPADRAIASALRAHGAHL